MSSCVLFLIMLFVFMFGNVWIGGYGATWSWWDSELSYMQLIVGTIVVVVPTIIALILADRTAAQLRFPWNMALYVAFLVLYWSLFTLLARDAVQAWRFFRLDDVPFWINAALPPLWRIAETAIKRAVAGK
jgi:hypothetical protein